MNWINSNYLLDEPKLSVKIDVLELVRNYKNLNPIINSIVNQYSFN